MYFVYMHTFPNGKIYIGQTNDIRQRWADGKGYYHNYSMQKDIDKYGWANIKHEIICTCTTREEAEYREMIFIIMLKSEDPSVGYNQTDYYDGFHKILQGKKEYFPDMNEEEERDYTDRNIFRKNNIPISKSLELINEWVYSEKARELLKLKYIDGLDYNTISERESISVRQLKRIVYESLETIERNL